MIQQPTIHHYIMSYDSDNELWYHDVEMEREKFEDGATINTETGVASWGYLGDGQYATNEEELNNQIVKAVEMMNAMNGQTPPTKQTCYDCDNDTTTNGHIDPIDGAYFCLSCETKRQTPAQRDTDMDIDYYIDYKEGE